MKQRVLSVTAVLLGVMMLTPTAAWATFPGADGRIAYEADGNIYTSRPDGTERRQLTLSGGTRPAWSPSGARVAYVGPSGAPGIWVMNSDGTRKKRLTFGANDRSPAWSRTGKTIAFSRDKRLLVMKADGTNKREITPNGIDPAWSPTAAKIVYSRVVKDLGYTSLFTIRPDGTGRTKLAQVDSFSEQANWRPDGRRVAFTSAVEDDVCTNGLYTITAAGTGLRNIYDYAPSTCAVRPVYSPRGTTLLFSTYDDYFVDNEETTDWVTENPRRFFMDPDGTDIRTFSEHADDWGSHDWQPLTPAGDVSGVGHTARLGRVALTWTNPTAAAFDTVVIRRRAGRTAPTRHTGALPMVTAKSSATLKGLEQGRDYTFTLFTTDARARFSWGHHVALRGTELATSVNGSTVSGTLREATGDAPLPERTIQLQVRDLDTKTWSTTATAVTDAQGAVSFDNLDSATVYRLRFGGGGSHLGNVTAALP